MCNKKLMSIMGEVQGRNMTRFGELYGVFEKLIGIYSRRIDKDDTAQELTLFLLETVYSVDLARFNPDGSDTLKRYIAVSLRNKYIRLSAAAAQYEKMSDRLCDPDGFEFQNPDNRIFIADGLKTLTKKQRIAVVYRYVYGYSDAELAIFFNCSRQAVHGLILRGLDLLKKYYEK